jgi:tRNA acetyltransferase TAN1
VKLKNLLKDFNLLATTSRGNERQMCNELGYLLKAELGDPAPLVAKTGIRGLVAAQTSLNPCEVVEKFRAILQERPYEFRYALRIIPVERVVPTDLDEVKRIASELAVGIGENETFRVTVEKRFTSLHTRDFIEAAATGIGRKVDLENPDKILLIEVVGGLTGISLIKPSEVLAVVKEKML